MYLIALCDDESTELDKTEQILHSYEKEHPDVSVKIERFDTALALIEAIREKQYVPDLIILDIYMPHKTGIDAAYALREMGTKSRIVFLTTSKEHALDAFRVEAAQYLVKPLSENTLFPILTVFWVKQRNCGKNIYSCVSTERYAVYWSAISCSVKRREKSNVFISQTAHPAS